MPGISGLDVIREMRRRGSLSAFILVTAYERFDIAREAMELGVLDYLLKPVAKDKLAASLRAAAEFLDRRGEMEMREIDYREREERMRVFVEAAFLHGIMLGERFGGDLERYCAVLGIQEGAAVVGRGPRSCRPSGCPIPMRKCSGFTSSSGPRCATRPRPSPVRWWPGTPWCCCPSPRKAPGREAVEDLKSVIGKGHVDDLAKGYLRVGFGNPRPLSEAAASWSEALGDLLGRRRASASSRPAESDKPFEDDDNFLEALLGGSPERARISLERLLEPLRERNELTLPERYRVVAVFGSAYRLLARRGLLEAEDAFAMMDFEDLRTAGNGPAFDLATRARFSQLIGIMERTPPLVAHRRPRHRLRQGELRQPDQPGAGGVLGGHLAEPPVPDLQRGDRNRVLRFPHRIPHRAGQGDALHAGRQHQARERFLRLPGSQLLLTPVQEGDRVDAHRLLLRRDGGH